MKARASAWSLCLAAGLAGAATVGGTATAAKAQAIVLAGYISNFDCYNETPEPCDEFEIEIEGNHPEDFTGFWSNYNYGYPVAVPNAAGTGVIVRYHNPRAATQLHAVEHFGLHFRVGGPASPPVYRWKHNGVVVLGGQQTVAPQPVFIPPLPAAPPVIVEAVENPEPEPIWVQRKSIVVPAGVSLVDLMPDNPLVANAPYIDAAPEEIDVGQTITNEDPEQDVTFGSAVVFAYDTFANVRTFVNGDPVDSPGVRLSTVIAAIVTNPVTGCEGSAPEILRQPRNTKEDYGMTADFDVNVDTRHTDFDPLYQWRKDGTPLVNDGRITNADGDTLTIHMVSEADLGAYDCVITNPCGETISATATLTLIHEDHSPRRCRVDWNDDLVVNPDDLGDYITGYYAIPPVPGCEFNDDGVLNPDDLGDFITSYFGPACG